MDFDNIDKKQLAINVAIVVSIVVVLVVGVVTWFQQRPPKPQEQAAPTSEQTTQSSAPVPAEKDTDIESYITRKTDTPTPTTSKEPGVEYDGDGQEFKIMNPKRMALNNGKNYVCVEVTQINRTTEKRTFSTQQWLAASPQQQRLRPEFMNYPELGATFGNGQLYPGKMREGNLCFYDTGGNPLPDGDYLIRYFGMNTDRTQDQLTWSFTLGN